MPAKKYLYDKLLLFLVSVVVFLAAAVTVVTLLRIGSGQGISEYYIEYRQGPHHSPSGDFSPTGSVWSILQFVWFSLIVAVASIILSIKTFKLKREVSVIVLVFGILLILLAFIVSNVLLGHR